MADELKSHLEKDINVLHERSQETKTHLSTHEAVCEERYAQIISTLTALSDEMKTMHGKLNDVNDLATQGKTSLRTLLWVGGVVASIIATLSLLIGIIPK